MTHVPGNALSRRRWLAACLAGSALAGTRGPFVENTTHMFASDQTRFPYHPAAPRRPPPLDVEGYAKFAVEAGLTHTVIVQSEAYQDDHRYLEHSFRHEPRRGFFKGSCLYDPVDPRTPERMRALQKQWPDRIVSLRIHEYRHASEPAATGGPFKDRDLRSPSMRKTWQALRELDLLAQLQMVPSHAPQVADLARDTGATVLLDHLALHARGTPAEYEQVIGLSRLPRVYMKVSSVAEKDKALVRRLYDAFGPQRLIWGSYGSNPNAFQKAIALSEFLFDYATARERDLIRGGNAIRLFRFPPFPGANA